MSGKAPKQLRLDPWGASSLLQKSIRRGEVELARSAAQTLFRHRGVAVFRRLCTIAVEDVGIADTGLLQDVVRIGTDKELRSVLGSDAELIDDVVARMALATKDRTADYLFSAATKLESSLAERKELSGRAFTELVEIASDDMVPLTRRAVAALLACAVDGKTDPVMRPDRVERFLEHFPVQLLPLNDAVLRLARIGGHPFCLMLPLIWARWWHFGAEYRVVEDDLPTPEYANGIPLYTYDFHTAVGKAAIAKFARENQEVATMLARWVPEANQSEAAGIAAFYADAAPVARRLDWPTGSQMAVNGSYADMLGAHCHLDGVTEVLECVRTNLSHLNALRRAGLGSPADATEKSKFCWKPGDILVSDPSHRDGA